jgi:signal peptidase II
MKTKTIFRLAVMLLLITANIGCDQVSKNIIRANINDDERISLVNNHLTITKTENPGAFLGLGDSLSSPLKNIFLLFLPLLALSIGFIFLLTNRVTSNSGLIGISFIIGGGIGNLFDRMVYGSVTDFLHIHFGIFRTGIFNLADVSIMAGIFIMIIHAIVKEWKPRLINEAGKK